MWQTVAAVMGGIVLIGNVGSVIYKAIMPALNNQKQTMQNSKDIAKIKERQENDLQAIQTQTETNKLMVRAMLLLVNHMIEGNHTEQMKETRQEIQDLLVKI